MSEAFTETQFNNEEAARAHLEAIRWPNGPVCPHCGGIERNSKLNSKTQRAGLYFCGDCREQFTVTVGTVLERSKIPLHKWLLANHLLCNSKKGASSHQIHCTLGVTYKTAWFMTHRLRKAMEQTGKGKLGGGGTVEADETYIGRKPGAKVRRGHGHKEAVVSLVERDGSVRSFHVPDVTAGTLKAKFKENVDKSARVMTDDAKQYADLGKAFLDHQSVNHSAKEVRARRCTHQYD